MILKRIWTVFAAVCCLSCSHSEKVISAGYIGDGDYNPSPAVMELLSEHALVSPGGHAYLYMKRGSGTEKPVLESVADIRLRVVDASGSVITEDETRAALKSAQPLLKDIVRQMVVGDKVRVWGDAYLRVWEIELLGFETNSDKKLLASGPQNLPENSDNPWVITKSVKGERLKDNQIVHVQIVRWKDRGEQGLEFDDSYDVLMQINKNVLINYYDLFLKMGVGEKARAWHLNQWDPKDAVYDIWIIDRYRQYETPDMLKHPSNAIVNVDYGVSKKLLYRPFDARPIVENQFKSHPFEISMNCWDETTGNLVSTTDLSTLGWSNGVTTTFRLAGSLELWSDLVDFEAHHGSDWFHDSYDRSKHVPDYDAYLVEYNDRKAKRPSTIVRRRHKGFVYYQSDLSEHWQKIIKDASFGDVFMLWIDHSISYRALKRSHPDAHDFMRDTVCRVEIAPQIPRP